MLQNRLGTRTKTSQTRVFCVFAVYLPLYQAVNFPKMIDGISLRFRFDRPFERPFRNQFSELAPGPQHSVQKIPSNGMQNLPNNNINFFPSLPDEASGRNVVEIVFVLPVFVIKCLHSYHPMSIFVNINNNNDTTSWVKIHFKNCSFPSA